jgi:hypothetical protein
MTEKKDWDSSKFMNKIFLIKINLKKYILLLTIKNNHYLEINWTEKDIDEYLHETYCKLMKTFFKKNYII